MAQAKILGKDLPLLANHIAQLQVPQQFSPEDLQRAQRDCEILAQKLRDRPDEMTALLEGIVKNKGQGMRHELENLGLTEDQARAEGGGFLWLIVLVVLLYSTDAY
jgi:hypothetical protein